MYHPFQTISLHSVSRTLIPLSVLTVVFMIALNWVSAPLNNPSAPNGIISFELAGDVETAKTILASWDAETKLIASLSLGLDYLFLVVYSTAIGMGCIWATGAFSNRGPLLRTGGLFLAWGQWIAAVCDGVENAALIKVLFGPVQSPWPQIARIFAIMKFALIALGLMYVMLAVIWKIIQRERRGS